MLKKAMIMAAGVGSRLEALSNALPKPLVPLANIPAMDILIEHLSSFGINNIIANTYYKSEIIQNHYRNSRFCIDFISENELSGTAGGLKKCQFFFNRGEDFIVMSGDGLSDIDIDKAYESHKKSNAIATIVLKEVEKCKVNIYGIVVRDESGYVKSFQEKPKIEDAKSTLANTGIYIFNYKIFDYIPEFTFYDFAKNVFPNLLKSGEKINTFILDGYWSDIGSIEQYKKSNFDILNNNIKSLKVKTVESDKGIYIAGNNFEKSAGAEIIGNCIFGNNCKIGKNSKIINSVIWNNVSIADNVEINDCIILNNIHLEESANSEIVAFNKLSSVLRKEGNNDNSNGALSYQRAN